MVDGTGTTSYAFDEVSRLITVTTPGPKTVGYRYNRDGNRTKLIYPDGTAVSYSFDKVGRLASLQDWASRSTSYQYFPDSSLKSVSNLKGTSADYSYDNAARLLDVWNKQGANTIGRHTYTLDAVGNRTRAGERLPQLGTPGPTSASVTSYSYDRLYRLTDVSAPNRQATYGYDPVGNRLAKVAGGLATSYQCDRANRLQGATTGKVRVLGSDVNDLRTAIDQQRMANSLSAYNWQRPAGSITTTNVVSATTYLYHDKRKRQPRKRHPLCWTSRRCFSSPGLV